MNFIQNTFAMNIHFQNLNIIKIKRKTKLVNPWWFPPQDHVETV